MKKIYRKVYEKQIDQLLGKPMIKVITGQRRTGKSRILQSIASRFQQETVAFLDLEYKEILQKIQEQGLHTFLQNVVSQKKLLCIDEIQKVPSREIDLLSIHREYPDLEIRITGSNSDMLASDLTTHLRGRYISLQIYPFSFEEYCQYFEKKPTQESFLSYIKHGGYPGIYTFVDNETLYKQQAKNIIDTIFVRDIVERYQIHNIHLLDTLFQYITNTLGNLFVANNFLKYYNKNNKTTFITLQQYIHYLSNAYLIYPIDIYDLQGKRILQKQQKIYISDHSRRKVLFSEFDPGQGKELENIFFIKALRQGREVYVGKFKDKEIDFVLQKGKQRKYIQVCYLLTDQQVIDREFGNLEKIPDNYPKYVLSLDPLQYNHPGGIQHIQFWNMKEIFQ